MQISESRKKFNEQYEQWQASGLSKAEFCRQGGFAYSWFMTHLKSKRKEEQVSTGFEKIVPTKQLDYLNTSIELHFPDGRYFVFRSGTPISVIRNLML